jgi:NADH-quinone oxidoreductase subunit C
MDETIVVKPEGLLKVLSFLKDDPDMDFNFLMDLTCADYLTFGKSTHNAPRLNTPSPLPYFMDPVPSQEKWVPDLKEGIRFEVIYNLYSLSKNRRVRIKVPLSDSEPHIDSVASLWKIADWFEREVWDMFGVKFDGHPDPRRILMYESFEGHPLRKDYPVNKRQPLIGPVN